MNKNLPKTWLKTPYERAEIWSKLERASSGLDFSIKNQRLDHVNMFISEIKRYIKQIERANVADAIAK